MNVAVTTLPALPSIPKFNVFIPLKPLRHTCTFSSVIIPIEHLQGV